MAGRKPLNDDYALYRGDELIAIGTLDELASMFGVQRKTIYRKSMPSYIKQLKNVDRCVVAFRLDDFKKEIRKIDKHSDVVLEVYSNVKEAAQSVNTSVRNLYNAILRANKTAAGYSWTLERIPIDE